MKRTLLIVSLLLLTSFTLFGAATVDVSWNYDFTNAPACATPTSVDCLKAFNVYYSAKSGGPYTLSASIAAPTRTVPVVILKPGKASFVATAVWKNADGTEIESLNSNEATVGPIRPDSPTNTSGTQR